MPLMKHLVLASVVALALTTTSYAAETVRPATPQPGPAALAGGLAVVYYYDDFRDTSLAAAVERGPGEAGPPLPQIDYRTGIGTVLTSDANDFVGAHITGFIHFDEVGRWELKVTSNDGVRLTVGDAMLFEDMTPHPDYDSPPLAVDVPEAGWYPLQILYYERKHTSTLRLWWRRPTAEGFDVVPAAAFKH